MSTLAQMRTRIADDLNRSDLSSQIDKAINRAILYYENERTWFNETTGTVSTVASQQAYGTGDGLPSDILEIDRITFTQSSNTIYTLKPRTIQYILDVNITSTSYTGPSMDWAWYQGKLYLYPTPDAAYTVTIYYKKYYSGTALSSDGDSNDWTDKAEDLIEGRAGWWLCSRVLKDAVRASAYKAVEMESLMNLRDRTKELLSTGSLRKTYF